MSKTATGRPFLPGVSGNPNGRPKLPPEIKEAIKMTRAQFAELLVKYLGLSLLELSEVNKKLDTPALDKIVIAIISNAIKKGDQQRLDFLINRIIGKVKEQVDHTSNGNTIRAVLVLPSNGRELNDRD